MGGGYITQVVQDSEVHIPAGEDGFTEEQLQQAAEARTRARTAAVVAIERALSFIVVTSTDEILEPDAMPPEEGVTFAMSIEILGSTTGERREVSELIYHAFAHTIDRFAATFERDPISALSALTGRYIVEKLGSPEDAAPPAAPE